MEIGSFIELDIRNTGEYYPGKTNIARLNAARAGIYHACRLYECSHIYIPFYLCPTVKIFLALKGIKTESYHINRNFEPILSEQQKNSAFLLVNYFGMFSSGYLENLVNRYNNVIIDNCASFYTTPLNGCYNVYSPRKFFGVPDGCYIIGENAEKGLSEYGQDFSSDTSLFLLKRIEVGSSASYAERMKNEERIDKSDILKMSVLTRTLLGGIDYEIVKKKRIDNFRYACEKFKSINLIDPGKFTGNDNIPMVYPLVVENAELMERLKQQKIYTGRWWNHVLREVPDDSFESWLSKYMLPIPVDQRYGQKEIEYVFQKVMQNFITAHF